MVGTIVSGVIFGLVAFIMLGIGIYQITRKEPVGFYSGEKPPEKGQLSDVKAWNTKHGILWIIYGICLIGVWIGAAFLGDTLFSAIPMAVGLLVPAVMMVCHRKLVKKYVIQ